MSSLITIWKNTDGCADQYRCATELWCISVLSQCHSIIFGQGISEPKHGREVIDGINAIGRRYMYQLMSTVQIPGLKIFEKQIIMHSCTPKNDARLAKYFQKHLFKDDLKHGVIDHVKYGKRFSKIE